MSAQPNWYAAAATATPLPKGMSHKKAVRWLAEHPEVDALVFWNDQYTKLRAQSQRSLKIAIIALSVSLVLQLVSLVLRLLA